ncbi:MAG: DNA primase [Rhodobiaceae bacterium]|nr:DNA primase [Rhodobiaceae bacterium]MCC0011908.1 DNA primase [Rhodobiaceae bacterium]MCC0018558.1 DNA primase [Rhodobiaceae bacterium]MCC0050437.1 DNA primase [Rhodobiaceae bacterium]MCC0061176.1 DNA primase [Rhodobiaceae bacterium]
MRFPPSFLDEIRNRVPVSAVVGKRVRLKKQGREMAGLSPFTKEKTPSFFVNDDKRFYHCFSSGKHGDIFTFLMEVEGLSFPEAVERLAGEAGLQMPKADPQAEARERERAGLYEIMEMAAAFFEAQLADRAGSNARAYLDKRGLSPQTIRDFRIGYAPSDRRALKQALASEGVSSEQMAEAGLIITGEDISVPFDRFRDRVIFPIADARGRTIAFGGRALQADQPAKYLNSPETPLFHKGETLFNISGARKAAHDTGTIHVVEGYMDVIAMSEGGFANTVAPLGTALTENQLGLLWRMADEPVLCFDGDSAGLRAAWRAAEIALPFLKPGKSLRFALMPEGQDPDDVLRSQGRDALAQLLGTTRSLVDIVWTMAVESQPHDTPERRAALEARLSGLVRAVGDESVRRHYGDEIARRTRELFGGAPAGRQAGVQRGNRNYGAGRGNAFQTPGRLASVGASDSLKRSALVTGARDMGRREVVILLTLINHPVLIADYAEELSDTVVSHPDLERLRGALVDAAADGAAADAAGLRESLGARGLGAVLERIDSLWLARADWFAGPDAADVDAESGLKHMLALHRKINTLHRNLEIAQADYERDISEANEARVFAILAELEKAEGTEAQVEGFGAQSGRPVRSF